MPRRNLLAVVLMLGLAAPAVAEEAAEEEKSPFVPTLTFQHGLSGSGEAEPESTEPAAPSTTNLPQLKWTFGLSGMQAKEAEEDTTTAAEPAAPAAAAPAAAAPATPAAAPEPSKRPGSLTSSTQGPR